jgi:hypothetical protein
LDFNVHVTPPQTNVTGPKDSPPQVTGPEHLAAVNLVEIAVWARHALVLLGGSAWKKTWENVGVSA